MIFSKSFDLVVVALLAAIASTANASNVETNASIYFGNALTTPEVGISLMAPVYLSSYEPGTTVSTGDFYWSLSGLDSSGQAQTGLFTGSAWAKSDYGVLKAFATATLTNPMVNDANPKYAVSSQSYSFANPDGIPTVFGAGSASYFSDSISGLSNVSSIQIKLGITGNIDHSNGGIPNYGSGLSLLQTPGDNSPNSPDTLSLIDVANAGVVDTEVLSYRIAVIDGVARFGFQLSSSVYFAGLEGGTFSGTVDASHTVKLDMVYGYDAYGNQVSLAGATSGSGAAYIYATAATVPEPDSWLLVLIGGLVVWPTVSYKRLGRKG